MRTACKEKKLHHMKKQKSVWMRTTWKGGAMDVHHVRMSAFTRRFNVTMRPASDVAPGIHPARIASRIS